MLKLSIWVFLLFSSLLQWSKSEVNVDTAEIDALYDLYQATNGENWNWEVVDKGAVWNFSVPDPNPCYPQWQGVQCSCTLKSCEVVQLDLQQYNLVGRIPVTISNLTQLTYLQLGNNHLRGNIPVTVGRLVHLTYLDLGFNYLLSGSLPETMSSLSMLSELHLTYNTIAGSLPDWLFNLTKLNVLKLNENNFMGTIPESIGNLFNLSNLHLGNNYLSGQVPSSIGNLTALQNLHLSGNLLNGTIPSSLCRLTSLLGTDWKDNLITGPIPSCIGQMTSLVELFLNDNLLSGSVPESMSMLVQLQRIYLYNNKLSGQLPPNLFNTSGNSLFTVLMYSNQLTGPIPAMAMSYGLLVDLSDNHLSGSLATSLCGQIYLAYLDISNNQIEGSLPSCLGELYLLQTLDMSVNQLTGTIPETLRYHDGVGRVEVTNNLLTGTIPYSLCLWNLDYLDLESNFLNGPVPECNDNSTFGQNGYAMSYFTVSSNLLSGTIPMYLQQQPKMATFTIDNNLFSGTLPSFVNATELVYLYVQSNLFHGPLQLNPNSSYIQYVDISNNQFSGTLPANFFNNSLPLKSFAATSNCITGSIPPEICSVNSLLFLDLDGLTTADQCRTAIFPGFKYFTSYTLKNQLQGGIPLCLFNMTNLQTIHISGNSVEWSFPSDGSLIVGDSLTELSLSHNKLTGTIPDAIQQRQWSSLDLSYNKLEGTLSFVEQEDLNASLVLQVNRLSGPVPQSLLSLVSIDILTGNLFACNLHRDALPLHDTAYHIYQCGSNSFNQASIIWSSCAAVAFSAIAAGWFFRYYWWRQFVHWCKQSWDLFLSYMSVFDDPVGGRQLHSFKIFIMSVRNCVFCVTIGIVLVFTPVYGALTAYYKTTQYQYAWTVSAAFLSGVTPAVVLLVFYLLFIVVLFVIWLSFTGQVNLMRVLPVLQKMRNASVSDVASPAALVHPSTMAQSLSLSFVVLVNSVVMILVNGAYVVVILNYSTQIIFFAQVATALFKLLWNDFAVRGMILAARRAYGVRCSPLSHARSDDVEGMKKAEDTSGGGVDPAGDENEAVYVVQEMPYMTFIVLFNSIIAPCLATAAVDSNCFYNVFVAPEAVSTQFPITNAVATCSYEFVDRRPVSVCNTTTSESFIEVSYDPPFIYSYQCTSSILTNYASVYVFMFLMVAFIKPMALYVMLRYHRWLKAGSFVHTCIDTTIYNLLKPANEAVLERHQRSGRRGEPLFHRERFVLRTVGKIAVFVTFGVIFPPLAAVLCVAFISETYLNLVIIGRFLVEIKDEAVRNQFRELLNRDCEDCTDLLLVPLVRLVVPFAALFYAFFVFDIYGDKVGFKRSVWAPVLLVLSPALLWLGYTIHSRLTTSTAKARIVSVNMNSVQMSEVNVLHSSM